MWLCVFGWSMVFKSKHNAVRHWVDRSIVLLLSTFVEGREVSQMLHSHIRAPHVSSCMLYCHTGEKSTNQSY